MASGFSIESSDELFSRLADYPSLSQLTGHVLDVWPDHQAFLSSRFANDSAEFLSRIDDVARLCLRIVGDDAATYCRDYKWMCEILNEEEIYFRRNGSYRLSTFEQAYASVYGDDIYMARYVHGLLLSQVLWWNHAQTFDYYRTRFLATASPGSDHLEVGPGHGLALYFAATDPRMATVTGWEISNAGIESTQHCLDLFGVADRVALVQQSVLEPNVVPDAFDSILISEVLEHLERPDVALHTLGKALRPAGRLMINVPINSPAPDHIYLWRSPEEIKRFVEDCGWEVIDATYFPLTGYTLKAALRYECTISCVLTCSRK